MLKQQLDELKTYLPNMQIETETDTMITITGTFMLNAHYDGLLLQESFDLKIVISKSFPVEMPKVYEIAGKTTNFHHTNQADNSLCLCTNLEAYLLLRDSPSLVAFLKLLIEPFFYSFVFYKKYGVMPFGERAHGADGILQHYKDLYKAETAEQTIHLFFYVLRNNSYRGHLSCPCGSGKPTRNCHADVLKVAFADKQDKNYCAILKNDLEVMNKEYVKSKDNG